MQTVTRRRLFMLLGAAMTGMNTSLRAQFRLRKARPAAASPQPFVFFGTDTKRPAAKGIYRSRFNPANGQLSEPVLAAPAPRASWMALNQAGPRRLLYVANEGDEQSSAISSYLLDPQTGSLTLLGQVGSAGAGPCYVAVESSGHSVFSANYSGGSIASFRVLPDGTLSEAVAQIDFHGKAFGHHGPNAARQDAPHPHSSTLSPDNRFLIVNDLGNDKIALFPINPATAEVGMPNVVDHRAAGSGPRHLAFHPNGRWAYGIDELTCRIDHYLWNTTHASGSTAAQAALTDADHSVSTLDPNFHGANTAAEIAVSASGHYLYASNRGEDSLVVFTLDQTNGAPTLIQRISCGGKTPRHFTLDPTGNWLLCGNQESASVTVFARSEANGKLSGPVQTLAIESPMFTLFA